MTTATSSLLLSPREIAAWQIPSVSPTTPKVRAELPALQRGAVWRARQVEALWDSVLRGFPIGAFLLAPFQKERGHKVFQYQAEGTGGAEATHHLLDGQQRSNALALGFLNPWSMGSHAAPSAALWIDLQAPASNDERDFVLRLLTRSHPWGYCFNSLASDGPRLAASMIRDAVTAYKNASPGLIGESCGQVPLRCAWPWDAFAPVPLCFLLDAVDNGNDVSTHLLKRLSQLPFWGCQVYSLHESNWQQRITKLLKKPNRRERDHMTRIVRGAKGVVGKNGATSYQVAALVVPNLTGALSGEVPRIVGTEAQARQQDAVETLFIRINSSGTPLAGEELIYSILKSIWPDAERFIQAMDVRLAPPSRIVALAARLVLSDADAFKHKPPATPDVARFRRLIHGADRNCKNFRDHLLAFFNKDKVNVGDVFRSTRDLLTNNRRCDLPSALAADITRRTPDVMFLLLRWVQRMLETGHEPRGLNGDATCRLLGAITALSWFAEDDGRCLSALWPALQTTKGAGLRSFFSAQRFVRAFKLTKGKIGLLPLVPPDVLEEAIESNVFGHGFKAPASELWQNWSWEKLSERSLYDHPLGTKLGRWYKRSFEEIWERLDQYDEASVGYEEMDLGGLHQQAWRSFVDKLWGEKALLLFAQREWLVPWLGALKYDPTDVDQLEEADRPWDFDHIHPASHIKDKRNVPQRIRVWHGSIGNLRAWPLQANRSDGDGCPRHKLSADRALDGLQAFGITSREALLKASFVDFESLPHWEMSTPDDDLFPRGYLGKPSDFGEQRKSLLRAIVGRWLRLYRHWYETLRIEDLGP